MSKLKKGAVYVFHAKGSDFYKIGWARHDVKIRMLSVQVGCPYELSFVYSWPGTMKDEKSAHRKYHNNWYRGEWFLFSEKEAYDLFKYKKKILKVIVNLLRWGAIHILMPISITE